MRSIYALAVAAAVAVSVPAFAQDAGSPGATGATNGAIGSNPPGSGNTDKMRGVGTNGSAPMVEQRATAPDTNTPGDKANPAPDTVRGGQNGQDMAK